MDATVQEVGPAGLEAVIDLIRAEPAAKQLVPVGSEMLTSSERGDPPLDRARISVNATFIAPIVFVVVLTGYMTVNPTTKARAPLLAH